MTAAQSTPLWDWAVAAYGAPGVSEACVALQDNHEQNVPVLLWSAWIAATGRNPDAETIEAACDTARAWDSVVVAPLRSIRRTLKAPVPDIDDGPRHPNAIRGCLLAVTDLGVAVVRTRDPDDTSLWLHRLAIRQERRRSSSRREHRRLRPPPGVTALAGIPGISDTTARALLDRFGTVERLLAAGPERWAEVDGIGRVRAHALAAELLG